jgi:RNA polymerase sigma-70 factor (ECF subfamily)
MVGRRLGDLADKRALVTALYETHFDRVVRYVAVRIGSVSEAEDLASEVFVRALRGVGSYKDTGAPMEAWLFKIAHNIVVDYFRKQSRRPASVPLEETFPLDNSHNPDEGLERSEEIRQLYQAVRQLSGDQQQVLALRFGSEMTSEQVGQVMGKKPGAVREMQSAAIKKLRQVLQRM